MEISNIEIRVVDEWECNEIHEMYIEAGWWRDRYDANLIPAMIRGSFAFVVAVDRRSGKAVGMGRAISDGVSDAYFQDFYVRDGFRGIGIGSRIMESLISSCVLAGVEWIGLIAEPGSEEFYLRSGFERMEGSVPMILGGDERP